MRNIMSFKIQRYIPIALVSLLTISIALNVYAYLKIIEPSPENGIEYGINALIIRDVQGGMGTLAIAVEHRVGFSFEYEMQYVSVPRTFNLSIIILLWEPYTGTSSYPFTIKLYERPLYGEYSSTSTAEKDIIVQKDKDAMYVNTRTVLTVTAPLDMGIYIYKVAIGGSLVYEVEFPILAV
ncbi:MAG TPA: hypothetical protein VIH48_02835 [Candidatus Bathyarchaeia archaeon]